VGLNLFVAAGLIVVVAIGLLLDVQLPQGGSVAVGHAIVIALAVLLEPAAFALVVAVAALAVLPVWVKQIGSRLAGTGMARLALASAVAVAAAHFDGSILMRVGAAGLAYVVAQVGLADAGVRLRVLLRVHLALFSAGALVAVAYDEKGWGATFVAIVPLLVIQFSFTRFARARRTYDETVRALSILPEVAGLTALGHGERTAIYAAAMARELNIDEAATERILTASRLHHIGEVSMDDSANDRLFGDPGDVGRAGQAILSETGFLEGVADMVAAVTSEEGAGHRTDVAVVRVASTWDGLVAAGTNVADATTELLARHRTGAERTAALALVTVSQRRPDLVAEARTRGALLRSSHIVVELDHGERSSCV
jgi:hypothetical protein